MSIVFVAMPTTNGAVKQATTVSLFQMGVRLAAQGIASRLVSHDGSNVVEARDQLAHLFLKSNATHLLFVDSDMEFPADACERLLTANKPVVGAAYTQKQIDFAKMKAAIENGRSFDTAFALAHTFNIRGKHELIDGLLNVEALGTGFMLIERGVFAQLETLQLRRYKFYGDELTGYFERTQVGEELLSEDLSFCNRWKSCGGDIWVEPNLNVRHIGDMSYGFPIASLLNGYSSVPNT